MQSISRFFFPGLFTACIVVCGFLWVKEEVTSRIYREKLATLAGDYASLAEQYNYAVRESAITELDVTEDSVTVVIRTLEGEIKRIETPYDPKTEIFVDYLVGNGRIWIRRIFDQATPPAEALVIDPVWEHADWSSKDLKYGKVVYRALEPGIWSIQVSGSGALSLEPAGSSSIQALIPSPEIKSYEEIQLNLDQEVREIGAADLWNYLLSLTGKD
ncbi:MAG: hypothetical protein AB3N63_19790 [Puniceicoccaceae bacterium]